VVRPLMTNLMDDLAKEIHNYLLEISTEFEGKHLVLIPITEVVKKFGRNHRTIQRRIHALKDEGLLDPVIKRNTIALYHIHNLDD
jgi:DNA-binding Lrp family transcriptional regulator|tara:strand:- start:131 stop:385 length:255 start_codon:yes stop_codon:yes gene_type:complete